MQENRSSEEQRRSRLIESLKSEAETQIAASPAQAAKGFRYPRSRWSTPAE